MNPIRTLLFFSLLLTGPTSAVSGQGLLTKIDDWNVEGSVEPDAEQTLPDGTPSVRLAPGSRAVLPLRDADGAGRVEIHFFDDQTKPAKPKERGAGPHVGVVTRKGRVLALGPIYAPYLSPDHLTVTEYPDNNAPPWAKVQHVGEKRNPGWRIVTFDFDAEKGLLLSLDGKPVKRYDWNKSEVGGFAGVVLVGDSNAKSGQTLWVGNVSATLGGDMAVAPEPPPPPPPVVPETDPEPEGTLATLNRERMRSHPRLLFTAEDLPQLREKMNTPIGKRIADEMKQYLPASKPPSEPVFAKDDTNGQRHGLWRLPTVALHAALTGDPDSLRHAVGYLKLMEAEDVWQGGKERNSGMGAANVLAGAALAYDWLYHDLEPEFREAFRQKLMLQARRMYYGGHLNRNNAMGYWQGDPHNNHRWHRNAGLTLAALAAYNGSPSETWLVETVLEELEYVVKWKSKDGSYSEGPGYMTFGGVHLMLALTASDHNLGTDFLQDPFFEGNGSFMLHALTPGRGSTFPFNDHGGGNYTGYAVYLQKVASLTGNRVVQAVMNEAWKDRPNRFTHVAWLALLWHDPTLEPAAFSQAPTRAVFPDSGVAYVRDGWETEDVGMMFRCMPIGGASLNAYRNANDFKYVNVAHDDPDANSFVLYKNGALLAETDRYSKQKQSANHNTILINGMGQAPVGRRPDPAGWMQPAVKADMLEMAEIVRWEPGEDVVIVEGEAAGSYTANRNKAGDRHPGLTRYRRTMVWVEGRYLLVLDDIRAPEAVELTWLMQGPELETLDEADLRFELRHENAACPFQVVSSTDFAAEVVDSPAGQDKTPLGWRQLRLSAEGRSFQLASVYDLWGKGGVTVELDPGADGNRIRVSGDGFDEVWQWTPAVSDEQPAGIVRIKN